MKWFSQRKGYKPVSEQIQTESMSVELRNSIWNVLHSVLWSSYVYMTKKMRDFSEDLWGIYFKQPIDRRPSQVNTILATIRQYFFKCTWFEVYDFLEFTIRWHNEYPTLPEVLNSILERELSGYRIIDGIIVEITDKQEIAMLESELKDTKYEGVTSHLRRSLELLSDRNNPDYRNSIKESISAVESMAKIITNDDSATLGQALKVLESSGKMHPSLKNGFSSLYGYTSDEGGIRHAMLEEPNITVADAKYFLLSCTSFVNYLKSRT